jgi:GrpB-like predicted nucleotidyltransferase (UPF0157 family)
MTSLRSLFNLILLDNGRYWFGSWNSKLVPHNLIWQALFNNEAKLISNTLGIELDSIQHVGSTSIPGILAKPIIDKAIPVKDLEIAEKWAMP